MGLPNENYKGYVEADATQRARNIPKKSLSIMHGLADLTAPYQHGVSLARALTEAGVLFRYQVRIATCTFIICFSSVSHTQTKSACFSFLLSKSSNIALILRQPKFQG